MRVRAVMLRQVVHAMQADRRAAGLQQLMADNALRRIDEIEQPGERTVSYTHLDVYKRQAL